MKKILLLTNAVKPSFRLGTVNVMIVFIVSHCFTCPEDFTLFNLDFELRVRRGIKIQFFGSCVVL